MLDTRTPISDTSDAGIQRYRWEPPAGVERLDQGIYLLHGMGEHAARYARLATRLCQLGFRVGSHDHPGHGRSVGKRGIARPADQLVLEAQAQFERFASENQQAPILFGHSLGGVVATQLILRQETEAAGLILSAPAIVPRISRTNRLKLHALRWLAPSFALQMPYEARWLTRDPHEIRTAESDPLIHGFKSAGLVGWLFDSAHEAIERAPEIALPTLLLIAGSDALIDTDKTAAFERRLPREQLTTHRYDGYFHEILNESAAHRESVMADIERWLQSHYLS